MIKALILQEPASLADGNFKVVQKTSNNPSASIRPFIGLN